MSMSHSFRSGAVTRVMPGGKVAWICRVVNEKQKHGNWIGRCSVLS